MQLSVTVVAKFFFHLPSLDRSIRSVWEGEKKIRATRNVTGGQPQLEI
jgi:hypothetical protein